MPVTSNQKKRFFLNNVEKKPRRGASIMLTQNKGISKEKFSLRTCTMGKSGSINEPITGKIEINTINNSAPEIKSKNAFKIFVFIFPSYIKEKPFRAHLCYYEFFKL